MTQSTLPELPSSRTGCGRRHSAMLRRSHYFNDFLFARRTGADLSRPFATRYGDAVAAITHLETMHHE